MHGGERMRPSPQIVSAPRLREEMELLFRGTLHITVWSKLQQYCGTVNRHKEILAHNLWPDIATHFHNQDILFQDDDA